MVEKQGSRLPLIHADGSLKTRDKELPASKLFHAKNECREANSLSHHCPTSSILRSSSSSASRFTKTNSTATRIILAPLLTLRRLSFYLSQLEASQASRAATTDERAGLAWPEGISLEIRKQASAVAVWSSTVILNTALRSATALLVKGSAACRGTSARGDADT